MNTDERAFSYVIGSLDDLDRADTAKRIPSDDILRARIAHWRRVLGPLLPPAAVEVSENPVKWEEVEAVVFGGV